MAGEMAGEENAGRAQIFLKLRVFCRNFETREAERRCGREILLEIPAIAMYNIICFGEFVELCRLLRYFGENTG